MAKSKETYNKKEKEKKRLKKRQEKREKMEERRSDGQKGKSLEDMMAYIDEDGNISSTPPDPHKKKVFQQEDMVIGVPRLEKEDEDPIREGVLNFYNYEKGFGFINDVKTGERIFVHMSNFMEDVRETDKVVFEVEKGDRGPVAVRVKKKST